MKIQVFFNFQIFEKPWWPYACRHRGLTRLDICDAAGVLYLYLTTLIIYSVSLVKLGAKTPEELTDGEIFYDLDRYPKIGMTADRDKRGSSNGYLTMVK